MDPIVVDRLKKYIFDNPDKKIFITGVSRESNDIFLKSPTTSEKIVVSIDDLESNRFDFNTFDFVKENVVSNEQSLEEEIEVMDEDFEEVKKEPTLQDLKDAVDSNDIAKIDSILVEKYKNQNTGLIDMNLAIETSIKNTVIEVANSFIDGYYSKELSDYDITASNIKTEKKEQIDKNDALESGFSNIKIFIEAAKLKGNLEYTEDKIKATDKKYKKMVVDKVKVRTGNMTPKNDSSTKEEYAEPVVEKPLVLEMKKAGFADVFILTAIVLIYAAIIINLILKLK